MLAKLGGGELCAGGRYLNGEHLLWLSFCFPGGEPGLSISVRILSGSHREPPLIRQDSDTFLSRSLPFVETAGAFSPSSVGVRVTDAQRLRPGGEF